MSLEELFRKVRRIQITTDHLVEGLLAGAYLSAFKGSGIEFEEVREYRPGDDVRAIDWNVSARMQRPYLKVFREERELSVSLLIDISPSMQFGTAGQKKGELALELAALIAFSAIRNQDQVGLLLFSDGVEKYLPPKKGRRHVLRLIREVMEQSSRGKATDIKGALEFFGRVQRKRAVLFLLSDFQAREEFGHQLRLLSAKHDVNLFHLSDPMERELPKIPLLSVSALEGERELLIDTTGEKARQAYRKEEEERREGLKKMARRAGAGWLEIESGRPYLASLKRYFLEKRR